MRDSSSYAPLLPDLEHDFPDAASLLCAFATPAEADMMRLLTFHHLYDGDVPLAYIKQRLRYTKPWEYADSLLHPVFKDKQEEKAFIHKLIELTDISPYMLTQQDMKKSCPYHDALNGLPILYLKDGTVLDIFKGELVGLRRQIANLTLHYDDVVSFEDLKQQLYVLNTGHTRQEVRQKRYQQLMRLTQVRIIEQHAHFPALIGQRGVFAREPIPKGTVLGYYSGDSARIGDDMPPLLCSWPMAIYRYGLSFYLTRYFIQTYLEWTDGYILGNCMKLVNTAVPNMYGRTVVPNNIPDYGNVGCIFGHFKTQDALPYCVMPFYIALRDIEQDEELMTFYPLG